MSFFSTGNILVHIPIGAGGYDLSWIEAIGTLFGLLCIWYASKEKIINYLFGLIRRHAVCGDLLSDPTLRQPVATTVFLRGQYLRLVCLEPPDAG